MTVSELRPSVHQGRHATVGRWTGRLAWTRSSVYRRIDVWHWSLFTDSVAVSLQWAGGEEVTFTEAAA